MRGGREDKKRGGAGAKIWMGWLQSKFVIVKNMRELRFGGEVNTGCADLWTSKQACVTITMLPTCFPFFASTNPPNQILCNTRGKTRLYNFFYLCFSPRLSCPNYRCTTCLFIVYHFWAALEPVWLKLPLGPGDLPACSSQWPRPRKHSDWSINN